MKDQPAAAQFNRPSARWALAFIIASLVALVVLPLEIGRRVSTSRDELREQLDPARTLVTRIQYALAREVAAIRGFLLTGDDSFRSIFLQARELERQTYRELDPLLDGLDARVIREHGHLETLSEEWYERIELEADTDWREERPDLAARIRSEHELFAKTLRAASELDEALAAATRARRITIGQMERLRTRLSVALASIAFLAALLVGWVGRRISALAREADLRHAETKRTLKELRRAVESKRRFIRGITHDIRNPLGAADGCAEILEMGIGGPLPPEMARFVVGIRRSIQNALEVIRDLLEVEHAESGQLPIRRGPIALDALVTAATEEYRATAKNAGHVLEAAPVPAGVLIHTDENRVRQILGNLLSNAIKFTPASGHIIVAADVSRGEAADDRKWVRIHVSDTGPGIVADNHDRIFDEFERLDAQRVPGYGLGLAVSRRVARLLGGDLTVSSEPGRGSTFTLALPVRAYVDGDRGARPVEAALTEDEAASR
jgi:signal transduction histidine kinase